MGNESSENASVVEQIGTIIGSTFKWLTNECEQRMDRIATLKQLNLQQELDNRIFQHMSQIQLELFEVFQHNRYPRLMPIKVPNNIRFDGYVYRKDLKNWNYFFTLDKSDFEEIARVVCDIIRKRMDEDMFSFKRELSYCTPDVQIMYPNMVHGIRVVNLENRMACVRITVVTAIKP